MITKEQIIHKYCCLYVSDFHLEMILLPFIKSNIDKTNVIIFTEKNLDKTVRILLDRINLKKEEKNKILDLKNWTNERIEVIKNENVKNYTIIINGSKEYIKNIEKDVANLNYKKITIVHCLDLNKNDWNATEIGKNYMQILNVKNIEE